MVSHAYTMFHIRYFQGLPSHLGWYPMHLDVYRSVQYIFRAYRPILDVLEGRARGDWMPPLSQPQLCVEAHLWRSKYTRRAFPPCLSLPASSQSLLGEGTSQCQLLSTTSRRLKSNIFYRYEGWPQCSLFVHRSGPLLSPLLSCPRWDQVPSHLAGLGSCCI